MMTSDGGVRQRMTRQSFFDHLKAQLRQLPSAPALRKQSRSIERPLTCLLQSILGLGAEVGFGAF